MVMHDTQMFTDTVILEALDFSHETPCDSANGCDNPARWRVVKACCDDTYLLCDPCGLNLKRWLEEWSSQPETFMECEVCKAAMIPVAEFIKSFTRLSLDLGR